MKVTAFLFSLFLFVGTTQGQNFQRIDAPVVREGHTLLSPWAGGVSAPQWSKVDLNGDGKMDIYEFDRDGFMHVPFLNTGGVGEAKYVFAPEYASIFPPIWHFVLLRDYNNDGVMDFFGHSQKEEVIPGFIVYNGKMENGQLIFEKETFSHWIYDVITYPSSNGNNSLNLNVNLTDYPAIDDIDGDGDLDILTLDPNSGSYITYYRNYALEQGFTTDTLIFRKEDNCWDKLALPVVTVQFSLSGSQDTCALQFAPDFPSDEGGGGLHGASTLCTFDEDNDGDKELLYGDLNYPQIMKAHNGGTPQLGYATDQDVTFPNYNAPVHLPDFPGSFHLDFDNDGLDDLLFAPNEFNISPDVEVWFYKNVASNEFPIFNLSNKNAMVDEMIDVGTGASPVFFDYNADGLLDIVIGNFQKTESTGGNNSIGASLYLLKNTGTITEPAFELIDDNWLNFKQYSTITKNYAPAFGDIDQDGDEDLFVGEEGGYLFFVENTAGQGNPATWGPIIPQWRNIRYGNYPTPFIYDLNKDGLADLIVGERGGNINYLPNIGTFGNPDFHDELDESPNNQFLGGIETIQSTISGFSAPVIVDFMDTVYIASGSESGYIELYEVDVDKLEFGDTFKLIDKQFGDLRLGTHSRISFANLNDDDILDAVVGNHRGGVGLFSSPFNGEPVVANETLINVGFKVFPNPALHYLMIDFEQLFFGKTKYQIVNNVGQIVQSGVLPIGENRIDINTINNGFYFIEIKQGGRVGVQKIVVQK